MIQDNSLDITVYINPRFNNVEARRAQIESDIKAECPNAKITVKIGGKKITEAYKLFNFGGLTVQNHFAAEDAVRNVCRNVLNVQPGTDHGMCYAVINGEYKKTLDENGQLTAEVVEYNKLHPEDA